MMAEMLLLQAADEAQEATPRQYKGFSCIDADMEINFRALWNILHCLCVERGEEFFCRVRRRQRHRLFVRV